MGESLVERAARSRKNIVQGMRVQATLAMKVATRPWDPSQDFFSALHQHLEEKHSVPYFTRDLPLSAAHDGVNIREQQEHRAGRPPAETGSTGECTAL